MGGLKAKGFDYDESRTKSTSNGGGGDMELQPIKHNHSYDSCINSFGWSEKEASAFPALDLKFLLGLQEHPLPLAREELRNQVPKFQRDNHISLLPQNNRKAFWHLKD